MKPHTGSSSTRIASMFIGALACALIASCGSETGTGGGGASGSGGASGAGGSVSGSGGASGIGGASGVSGSGGFSGVSGAGGAGATGGASGSSGVGGDAGSGGTSGSSGTGAGGTGAGGTGAGGSAGHGTNTCLKPGTGDYSKRGPYQARRELVDLGMNLDPGRQATGEATIYYPEPFEANCPHPIVAWGNGTGAPGPDIYGFFNDNAASWGVVVIGAHDSNVGNGNYHKKGLDYLLEQNAQSGSKYYQKLSPRAGVSGHSQGGAGALRAINHPNVRAFVPVGMTGAPLPTTAFLCLTGTADIAIVPTGCKSATQAATGPAFTAIWEGGDHVSTETLLGYVTGDPGTIQMMRLYAAWFRCFLGDDGVACRMFEGGSGNCGICNDQGWAELVMKNL